MGILWDHDVWQLLASTLHYAFTTKTLCVFHCNSRIYIGYEHLFFIDMSCTYFSIRHINYTFLEEYCLQFAITTQWQKGTVICDLQLWVLKHCHRNFNYFSCYLFWYNKFLVKIMKCISSICEIWDSQSGTAEDSSLLVRDNVSFCKWFLTFQRPQDLQGSSPLVLQNSENHSPNGIAVPQNSWTLSCSCNTIVHIFVIILPLVTWMY